MHGQQNIKIREVCLILVNNQLDAQFFMYVYFDSLHISGSHVPIIKRIIVSMRWNIPARLAAGSSIGLTNT